MMQVIKMASLALVASHTINGVACTHTELLKGSVFKVGSSYLQM